MEQLELMLPSQRRRAQGEAKQLLLSVLDFDDWTDIRAAVERTGMTRQAIHRIIVAPEFEVLHNGRGRGHACQLRRARSRDDRLQTKLDRLWPVKASSRG